MNIPKLYIFDLGGVCIFNFQTLGKIASTYHLEEQVLIDYYMTFDRDLMEGTVTTKQLWVEAAKKYGLDEGADPLVDLFTVYANTPLLEQIRRMKQAGIRVVCGSNTCEPHWLKMEKAGDLEQLFDACYLSQRMHLSKPDPRFFQEILKKEQVEAKDAIFIDDTKANTESAEKLGLRTIWYHDDFIWSALDKVAATWG
jgi:FMN phosphatase YigB (HAD superfamily)